MKDKGFRVGVVLTLGYVLVLAAAWKFHMLGDLPTRLNEWGDFASGLCSPLAFLWLVLGYRQQGEELRAQAAELKESVSQQVALVKATNEQNRLQLRALEAAEEQRVARFRPALELRYTRHEHVALNPRVFCVVLNTGGAAYDMTVEVDSAGAKMDALLGRPEILRNESTNLEFEFEFQSVAVIRLTYTDEEGMVGTQQATLYQAGEPLEKTRKFRLVRP